ncbi:hypothetical protein VNI00_006574 [Paramarasmius palmivorus]|uniref:Uncharacterized protein n=1 Tax=Paramarasmius palmivorus TaxID=297713 RepID=A0AAW0D500_9AGAR
MANTPMRERSMEIATIIANRGRAAPHRKKLTRKMRRVPRTDEESQSERASARKNALRPRTICSAYTASWAMESQKHFSPQPPQMQPIQSVVMEDVSLLDSVPSHPDTPRDMIPSRMNSDSHPTSFSRPTQSLSSVQSVTMDDASSFHTLPTHTLSFCGTFSSEKNSHQTFPSLRPQHRAQTVSSVQSIVMEDAFPLDSTLDTQASSSQRTPSMMDVDLMSRSGSLMSIDEPDPKPQGSLAWELEPFCHVGALIPSVTPAPCSIQGPHVAVLHPNIPLQVDNTQFPPPQHSHQSSMVYSPGTSFGNMPPPSSACITSSGLTHSSPFLPHQGMSTFNPHANFPPQTIDIPTNPMSLFHESQPAAGTYNHLSPAPSPGVGFASQLYTLNPYLARPVPALPVRISARPMATYSSHLEAQDHRVDNHVNPSNPGYSMVQYPRSYSEFSAQPSASAYPVPGSAERTSCGLESTPTRLMNWYSNVEAASSQNINNNPASERNFIAWGGQSRWTWSPDGRREIQLNESSSL